MQFDTLSQTLDYEFNNPALLKRALTHRSVGNENNERLEFLGDAILGMVISTDLYQRFPDEKEGVLTRLRASLVKGDTLAKLAKQLQLGDFILLGSGELKSGGFRRASILADALEAVIGAIYLDSGIEQASQFVRKLFQQRLDACDPAAGLKDPKTRLQEYLQALGQALPKYEVISVTGKEHQQTFEVSCQIQEQDKHYVGKGSSRRKAEQAAAELAMNELQK